VKQSTIITISITAKSESPMASATSNGGLRNGGTMVWLVSAGYSLCWVVW
jgi:hypothetical protein